MNIIFVDEEEPHEHSIYLDHETTVKEGWNSPPQHGIYVFYLSAKMCRAKPEKPEPAPAIFI